MATLASFIGVELPTKLVHNKATYHRNFIEVWTPKSPYLKLQDGWEPTEVQQGRTMRGKSVFQDENNDRSIRRTKRKIKSLAINNEFQLWITLTMGKDRHDEQKTYTKLENWLKSEKRRVGKFDYLIVPERHKDGAIHFHGLIGSYKGELVEAINQKTGKLHKNQGKQTYHFKSYTHGLHTVEYIENHERIATYITKYITKDMQTTTFNKKRYWANKTLKQPETEENPVWLAAIGPQPHKIVELEQGTLAFYPTTARKQPHIP